MTVLVIDDSHGRCSLLLEEGVRVSATTRIHAPTAKTATLGERAAALGIKEA